MLTDAISGVTKLITRLIDLIDEDPERRRQRLILRAKTKLLRLEKDLDKLEKDILSSRSNNPPST